MFHSRRPGTNPMTPGGLAFSFGPVRLVDVHSARHENAYPRLPGAVCRSDEGMAAGDAIQEATRNRLRPIFMSTLTSVVGMLPLVLFPGAGSELYRGLGSVVVGGLALSALLTLIVVPPLMSVFLGVSAPKPHDDQLATEPAAPLPEAALAEAVPVRAVAAGGDGNVVTWPKDGRT